MAPAVTAGPTALSTAVSPLPHCVQGLTALSAHLAVEETPRLPASDGGPRTGLRGEAGPQGGGTGGEGTCKLSLKSWSAAKQQGHSSCMCYRHSSGDSETGCEGV